MGAGYDLNQANPLLHQMDLGHSLWAVTRNRQGRYVLIDAPLNYPDLTFEFGTHREPVQLNLHLMQ